MAAVEVDLRVGQRDLAGEPGQRRRRAGRAARRGAGEALVGVGVRPVAGVEHVINLQAIDDAIAQRDFLTFPDIILNTDAGKNIFNHYRLRKGEPKAPLLRLT